MSKDREFDERKKILEEIKKFNRTEQESLYHILCKQGEDISENKNGMFFDLLNVKEDTINYIKELIKFINANREIFETREKEMNSLSASLKN